MTIAAEKDAVHDDIAVARRVLDLEARGLASLSAALESRFVEAVEIIEKAHGRIIVSGMGKSGHIARKIAATFASTGTPAQYVHPGEASHGDLGMITADDAVLALSNSGKTPELADLVAYTRLCKIPLIAMTSESASSLARAAEVALVLPPCAEACTLELAPTTSTTMMMALGDAIAIALLERQGFSPEHFHALHPGGQLGRRFITVGDLMHEGEAVPLLPLDALMSDVLLVMTAKSFGCVGILDKKSRLAGVITDGDLRRHMNPDLLSQNAAEIMTESPKTIGPNVLAAQGLRIMNDNAITSLFVVENEVPVGILHIHDCVRTGVA